MEFTLHVGKDKSYLICTHHLTAHKSWAFGKSAAFFVREQCFKFRWPKPAVREHTSFMGQTNNIVLDGLQKALQIRLKLKPA